MIEKGKSNNQQFVKLLCAGIVLLEAFNAYFLRNILPGFPVNAVLPLLVIIIIFHNRFKGVVPSHYYLFIIGLGVSGLIIGIFTIEDSPPRQIYHIGGACCAYLIGYAAFRGTNKHESFGNLFFIVGFLYTIVGILALLKVCPILFPVIDSYWSNKGTIVGRPEVMTDQNFQIIYLIPVILALQNCKTIYSSLIAATICCGALFFLIRLQTRSGVLIFLMMILILLFILLRYSELGRRKILALVGVGLIGCILFAGSIIGISSNLIARFTDSKNHSTAYGRIYSSIYAFEHLFEFEYWIPHGNKDFQKFHGDVPHSNIAAMYMDGGIPALMMWFLVFLMPVIRLNILFIRRKVDKLACMVLLGATGVMVAQLTLNVPLNPQVWFWAGASASTLNRLKERQVEIKSLKSFDVYGQS